MGYSQTFFPFGCLLLGCGLAILFALCEFLPMARPQKGQKSKNTEKLYDCWDERKFHLSEFEIEKILKGQYSLTE